MVEEELKRRWLEFYTDLGRSGLYQLHVVGYN